MKSKKNPSSDVRRNSSIFFAVGLVLMLLAANYAINYRSYDKETTALALVEVDAFEDDVIPITKHPEPPLPDIPKPVIPEDFDVKEDDDEVIEDLIDSTEYNPDEPILEVSDIEVDAPEENIEVPVFLIEDVPVFPGCEEGSNDERRACLSEKITKHVQKKFNVDLAADLGLSGKQRISVMFKIDKNGDIIGVQSRAPHPKLENEAARVINLLPKMKPGKQGGKTVTVKYSLPIIFQVQN